MIQQSKESRLTFGYRALCGLNRLFAEIRIAFNEFGYQLEWRKSSRT